eukprot:8168402-Alexandrium_andersonii.AAC.1
MRSDKQSKFDQRATINPKAEIMVQAEAGAGGDLPTDLEADVGLKLGDRTVKQPQVEPLEAVVEAPREFAEAGASVGVRGLATTAELD